MLGNEIDISLLENLMELQSDEIFQTGFKDGKHNVWKSNDTAKEISINLGKEWLYVTACSSFYLIESSFSHVSNLLSKVCERLDIVQRGDLQLHWFTKINFWSEARMEIGFLLIWVCWIQIYK